MKTISEVVSYYSDLAKYDLTFHRQHWNTIVDRLSELNYPELDDREYRVLWRREEGKLIYELCTVCHPEIEELDEIDIQEWHSKNQTLCTLLEV